MKRLALLAAAAVAVVAFGNEAAARDRVSVVASSSSVAYFEPAGERLVQAGLPAPKVVNVSTGDKRLKIFCGRVGVQYPDVAGMSKKLKDSQIETCKANSVTELAEIKFGYDGV